MRGGQGNAALIEGRPTRGLVSVDAEELASGQRPDGVVVGALALILVEDGIRTGQGGVPLRAAGEVADGDGGVRDRGEIGHDEPSGSTALFTLSLAGAPCPPRHPISQAKRLPATSDSSAPR